MFDISSLISHLFLLFILLTLCLLLFILLFLLKLGLSESKVTKLIKCNSLRC
uniref:Uncharacterized protein n=1 Tax=Rhizophora mucronata TaxID=61149 RepID=A0A2P2PUD8_RHIMU